MSPLWRRPLAVLALLGLASRAGAAAFEAKGAAASPVVYALPTPSWTTTLSLPANLTQVPGLDPANAQSLAPIAHELTQSLHYTPESFMKLPESDRATAVHLAFEEARHNLMQKVYELAGRSKEFVWSKDEVGRQQLDAMYPVAAKLREIDRNYGAFLDDTEKEVVAASAAQAAAAWRDARAAYVAKFGEAAKKGLEAGLKGAVEVGAKPGDSGNAFLLPAHLRLSPPSKSAVKLIERMRATKSGWGQDDLATVYLGYGFNEREGGKHRMYTHPVFAHLHTTVSRQNDLAPGYAQTAVKLIAELEALSAPAGLPDADVAANDNLDDELPPPLSEDFFPKSQRKTPPKGIPAVAATLEPVPDSKRRKTQPETPAVVEPAAEETAVAAVEKPADPTKLQPAAERSEIKMVPSREALENASFVPADDKRPKTPWWRGAWDRLMRRQ